MSKKLEGKIAVITGGNSGMGLATAKRFVEEGAYVFVTGRRQKELDEAVKVIGENVTAVQGDVANLADLERLFETVKIKKGHLDVLFTNAGVGYMAPFESFTEEMFDKTFDVNVRGTFFTIQKALPLFTKGGSIILTGSMAGNKGIQNFTVYNASKAAVRSFARSLTMELKDRKIRTNVISPGPIDTPTLAPLPKEVIQYMVSTIPLGHIGAAEEIAKAAVFLASDDSDFITGIELGVDGGLGQV
jgi:NAD(P)-dependent dehydrogenase (short-subunit alcohol dehydrogenase family)